MSETKVTTFRFTDDELEVLGVIEGQTGIRSRTEALRGVLRDHSDHAEPGPAGPTAAKESAASTASPASGGDAPPAAEKTGGS